MVTVGGLFSGIGGIELGSEKAGFKILWSNEFDENCNKTFRNNLNHKLYSESITDINFKKIKPVDVLVGGFPCQAFSVAGYRTGFKDERGNLFFQICRAIEELKTKPKVLMLENVKNLTGHDKGKTLQTIVRVLNDMDYNLSIEVLNAKHFGLPQNRERIFIIGFKEIVNFQFPTPPMTPTRLGGILQKRVSDKFTISDRIWKSHQERKERARSKGYGFGYSLFNLI